MKKNFDLTGWTCFSQRRNSKSYMSPDKKWMVKFGTEFAEATLPMLEHEMEVTKKALEVGVKTPKVDDIVELPSGELGLIYEYIEGKKSIARAAGEDTDNIDYYMKRFARISKDLHSKVCDPNKFESVEDRVREQIKKRNILTESQKEKAYKLLDGIEKKYTCIHGDFQTGNFIIAGDNEFAIDLGAIAYGNPDYDVACFYYFCHYFPSYVTDRIFHCDQKYLPLMWRSFIKYYYDTTDDKVLDEITKKNAKYALVCFFGQLKHVEPGPELNDAMNKYFDKEFAD